MPVFNGNVSASVQTGSGFDIYGQPSLGLSRSVMVKVVKFDDLSTQTGIHGEESASHAKLDEKTTVAEILFPPTFSINIGDIVTIFGSKLEIKGIFPRYSLRKEHQHNKAFLSRKQ